jgi:hypothetical protein
MMTGRAEKYRRLALAEPDAEKARVLRMIAEEAERGVLCTSDWLEKTSLYGETVRKVE